MFPKDLATRQQMKADQERERRGKYRFPMQRELRYKILKDGATVEAGVGQTIDIGSGGVGFALPKVIPANCFIELSISWPVLLDNSCPMQLIVFGRVLRTDTTRSACTIEKYEFRTQSRLLKPMGGRADSVFHRWADTIRKDPPTNLKAGALAV